MIKRFPIVFAVILLIMYIQLFFGRTAMFSAEEGIPPKYHMQIICTDLSGSYFIEFAEGALQAQAENDIFVEFVEADRWNSQGVFQAVQKGIEEGVDGIAFQANDPGQISGLLEYAEKNGTKLLLYESEDHQNIPILSAESDPYLIGCMAGELALDAVGSECRAVVVTESARLNEASVSSSLKLLGITDTFSENGIGEIVEVYPLDSQAMSGEVLVNTLLESRDSYNTIISLSDRTTPLMAERLLHHGYFREITLIGYGVPAQNLNHIDRGITYGIICPDAGDVGYRAVLLMIEALEGGSAENYLSDAVYSITRRNVIDFLLKAEDAQ